MNVKQLPNGVIVTRTNIITTDVHIYAAWEPSSVIGPHSSLMVHNAQWYGRISSRKLPRHLEDLKPLSNRRFVGVRKWQIQQDQESYEYILAAFPELKGKRSMGEIHTQEEN